MIIQLRKEHMHTEAADNVFGEARDEPVVALAEVDFAGVARYYFVIAKETYMSSAVQRQATHTILWQHPDCPKDFMDGVPLQGYSWYHAACFDEISGEMTNRSISVRLRR